MIQRSLTLALTLSLVAPVGPSAAQDGASMVDFKTILYQNHFAEHLLADGQAIQSIDQIGELLFATVKLDRDYLLVTDLELTRSCVVVLADADRTPFTDKLATLTSTLMNAIESDGGDCRIWLWIDQSRTLYALENTSSERGPVYFSASDYADGIVVKQIALAGTNNISEALLSITQLLDANRQNLIDADIQEFEKLGIYKGAKDIKLRAISRHDLRYQYSVLQPSQILGPFWICALKDSGLTAQELAEQNHGYAASFDRDGPLAFITQDDDYAKRLSFLEAYRICNE